MVQQAMQYIDETPDLEARIELIKTLNTVSAGKVRITFTSFLMVCNGAVVFAIDNHYFDLYMRFYVDIC